MTKRYKRVDLRHAQLPSCEAICKAEDQKEWLRTGRSQGANVIVDGLI